MSTTNDDLPATHCKRCGDPLDPGASGEFCTSFCRAFDSFRTPLNLL